MTTTVLTRSSAVAERPRDA